MQQPPQQQLVTRRYGADAQYTADAARMATAGWRVVSVSREPAGALVATYAPTGAPLPALPVARPQHPLTMPALIAGVLIFAIVILCAVGNVVQRLNAETSRAPAALTTSAPLLAPTPTDTATPSGATVTGARLGGPIFAFDARYGSDNPPGPIYQWNTTISGVPVQLTVSLSRSGDTRDGQTRAVIIDIAAPSAANAPWSAKTEAALVSSFLPSDAHHINDVAGSGALGPDHIYMSQQLANSLTPSVFALGASSGSTPGMFDWQCSTQQPYCELAPGTNSASS